MNSSHPFRCVACAATGVELGPESKHTNIQPLAVTRSDQRSVVDRDFVYLCSYLYMYLSALFDGASSHLASALS